MDSASVAQRLLAAHDGVARRADLVRAGVSRGWLGRRLADGDFFEPFPGVISESETPAARLLAAQTFGGEGARLSHTTASHLYGLRRIDRTEPVHVAVPNGRKRQQPPGLMLHQTAAVGHVAMGPLRVVPLPQTLVDVMDLLGLDEARFMAAEACRRGLTRPGALRADASAPRRLSGKWAALLEELRAGAASGGEAKYWRALKNAHLPMPELNAHVRLGSATFVLDGWWRDYGLAAEVDGRSVHGHAAAFEADRSRQNALQAAGIVLIRFPVAVVMRDPTGVAEQTRAALLARAHELRLPRRLRSRTQGAVTFD